jgi:hypothetical protein
VLVGQIASLFSRLLPGNLAVQLKRPYSINRASAERLDLPHIPRRTDAFSPNLERTRIDNPHVDGMLLGQIVKDNVVPVTDLYFAEPRHCQECRKFLGRRSG